MSDTATNLEASLHGQRIKASDEYDPETRRSSMDAEIDFHADTVKAERAGKRVYVQLSDDKGQYVDLLMTEDLAYQLRTALREILR